METTPQEKVIAIIVDKLGVEEADVTPEASFTNDLGADSLDTVELIMELETVFNVTIPDEDAEKIVTVGDALNYIATPPSQVDEGGVAVKRPGTTRKDARMHASASSVGGFPKGDY